MDIDDDMRTHFIRLGISDELFELSQIFQKEIKRLKADKPCPFGLSVAIKQGKIMIFDSNNKCVLISDGKKTLGELKKLCPKAWKTNEEKFKLLWSLFGDMPC